MTVSTISGTAISEALPLKDNVAAVNTGRMRIRIIEGDRWGSSGYYSSEMLKRDGPNAFPKGTQMYLDHPGAMEEMDRPERTLRDLVGVLESDAVYEKDGLYADALVYSNWGPVIAEMAEDIGLSIRAFANIEEGTVKGKTGPIVKELIEGISVDYVTKAGAGGKIVQLIESARSAKEASSNNRRAQLDKVVASTYGDAWVRDLDEKEKTVWFTVFVEGSGVKHYGQKFKAASDDNSVSLTGERWEVLAQTSYVPVPTTASTSAAAESDKAKADKAEETVPERPGKTKEGANMGDVTLTEAEHKTLVEASGRVTTLEAERDEALKQAKENATTADKATRERNKERARRVVGEMFHDAGVKAPRLAESLSIAPPLTDEGEVDEDKLKEQAKEAVSEIQVELSEAGPTGVRGFGGGSTDDEQITEADIDKLSASTFGRKVSA